MLVYCTGECEIGILPVAAPRSAKRTKWIILILIGRPPEKCTVRRALKVVRASSQILDTLTRNKYIPEHIEKSKYDTYLAQLKYTVYDLTSELTMLSDGALARHDIPDC